MGTNSGSSLYRSHATHDDAVRNLSHAGEVIARGNAETDRSGFITGVLLYALQELRKVSVHCTEGTSDTLARDNVDERIGDLAKHSHTMIGGGRGNQWNIR